jgi:ADP-ribose pyrophosphatase
MAKINRINKQTENRFLNMYEIEGTNKVGHPTRYFVASRAEKVEDLKISTGENRPDGVVIYSLYGEAHDRVVLIRQYRYPIDGFVYEFPAGLVDAGESYGQAAVREMHEETGLAFTPLSVDPLFEEPRFTTVGLTDESCATVYGYASGQVTKRYQEELEEIEVVLADRKEVRRILKEERVAIMCAYQLMHFLQDEDPFAFLQSGGKDL